MAEFVPFVIRGDSDNGRRPGGLEAGIRHDNEPTIRAVVDGDGRFNPELFDRLRVQHERNQ